MKKIIILLLMVIFSFTFFGCTKTFDNNLTGNNGGDIETNSLSERVITSKGDWPYYESIEELAEACDHIIIGKVEKVLPAIRINETVNPEHEVWNYYTPSQILIGKVLRGNKTEGETICIVQDGGTYTGITENKETEKIVLTMEDVIFMEEGSEYLLFVRGEENVGKGMEYSYFLPTPTVGYCKIIDGKLSPNEGNNLFMSGTTVDEAIAMIEECSNLEITAG